MGLANEGSPRQASVPVAAPSLACRRMGSGSVIGRCRSIILSDDQIMEPSRRQVHGSPPESAPWWTSLEKFSSRKPWERCKYRYIHRVLVRVGSRGQLGK